MSGRFITFEGLDGSGKSTHLKRAAAWLEARGIDVLVTHEPGGTPVGEAIRDLFLKRAWDHIDSRVEAMMVFASRRQHIVEIIQPAISVGRWVVCDRFTDSTHAYQGYARGLSADWVARLDELATDGLTPDRTLLFDLPAAIARDRGNSPKRQASKAVDRLDAEGLAFYERVRGGYLKIAAAAPERVAVIDSSGEKEATWHQVETVLRDEVEGR